MATGFIGEIRMFGFGFPPRFWARCDGQLLPINQNQALFSILGTTYGGNGTTNFALPNLQGRVPVHAGTSPPGLTQRNLGEAGGASSVTLLSTEMPQHSHSANAGNSAPNQNAPTGNFWAQGNYAAASNGTMSTSAIQPAGGSQPHENVAPYLVVNFCIALQGIFPSRN